MAKCDLTGKTTTFGQTIQHQYGGGWRYKAQKKKRTFKPNIQSVRIKLGDFSIKLNVCTRYLKTLKSLNQKISSQAVFSAKKGKDIKKSHINPISNFLKTIEKIAAPEQKTKIIKKIKRASVNSKYSI